MTQGIGQVRGTTLTVDYHGQALSLRYDGLVTPAFNRQLTNAEYRRACLVTDCIAQLKARISGAPGSPSTGSDIARGANAWAGGQEGGWHPLFGKQRLDFEHLRLFCQPFTGFDPISNRIYGGAPGSIPADIHEKLRNAYTTLSIHSVEFIADRRRLPGYAQVMLPLVFGEVGPMIDGALASYDAWSLQLQINGLYGTGLLERLQQRAARKSKVTVADIGSGFGGLGYQLGRAIPGNALRFVAIDLPDSLLFAAIYLSCLWDDRPSFIALPEGYVATGDGKTVTALPEDFAAVFVVSSLADRVLSELAPLDLMLNFRSMQEMSAAQVERYGQMGRATLGDAGLLYEQNGTSRSFDTDVKGILGNVFPHGGLVEETAPPHRGMAPSSLWSNCPIPLTPPGAMQPDGA